MNILIATFLSAKSPSGVVTYVQSLTEELAGEGVRVGIVNAERTPDPWRKVLGLLKRVLRPRGGALHALYEEFAYFTGVFFATWQQRRQGFDLIHAQDVRSGVAAYLALGRRVPVVLTCHFNDDPITEAVSRFEVQGWFLARLTRWYGWLFSHIRHYVFVSNYAYEKSKHLLPAGSSRRIIHNTVQLDREAEMTVHRCSKRMVISNVGYVDERKNQLLLIDIAQELRRRGQTDFTIWLIGDGPKRADYEALVCKLNLCGQVQFCGRQAAPWRLVAQTDLYVHTALNDNCPYSIVEAMAVGTPVLALPVGGVPELLPPGVGLLHGTDVPSLTDELLAYFDPKKRAQLQRTQADFAAHHINHRQALATLMGYYAEVVKGEKDTLAEQPQRGGMSIATYPFANVKPH
jgi:glycosyltransferase involved in cell wall biosynthesis